MTPPLTPAQTCQREHFLSSWWSLCSAPHMPPPLTGAGVVEIYTCFSRLTHRGALHRWQQVGGNQVDSPTERAALGSGQPWGAGRESGRAANGSPHCSSESCSSQRCAQSNTEKSRKCRENVRKVMRSRLQHYLYKINTHNINAFSDYLHVHRHMLITTEECQRGGMKCHGRQGEK